ncbi:hypothetical protein Tco_0808316 [Tanacetum coccineum]
MCIYGWTKLCKKKDEERRMEEQAAKDRIGKDSICYDDGCDYTLAITNRLTTKEPLLSRKSMAGVEHLGHYSGPVKSVESNKVIVSRSFVPILSESEGNIDYVDASFPDAEIVSLEAVEIDIRKHVDHRRTTARPPLEQCSGMVAGGHVAADVAADVDNQAWEGLERLTSRLWI